MSGEVKSDSQPLFVGNNGEAARERVEILMPLSAKEQIEEEFASLGVQSWQELLGHLLNHRQKVFAPQVVPEQQPIPKEEKTSSSSWSWWIAILLGLLLFALLLKAFSSQKNLLPNLVFNP